jgi:hypothetical protein
MTFSAPPFSGLSALKHDDKRDELRPAADVAAGLGLSSGR